MAGFPGSKAAGARPRIIDLAQVGSAVLRGMTFRSSLPLPGASPGCALPPPPRGNRSGGGDGTGAAALPARRPTWPGRRPRRPATGPPRNRQPSGAMAGPATATGGPGPLAGSTPPTTSRTNQLARRTAPRPRAPGEPSRLARRATTRRPRAGRRLDRRVRARGRQADPGMHDPAVQIRSVDLPSRARSRSAESRPPGRRGADHGRGVAAGPPTRADAPRRGLGGPGAPGPSPPDRRPRGPAPRVALARPCRILDHPALPSPTSSGPGRVNGARSSPRSGIGTTRPPAGRAGHGRGGPAAVAGRGVAPIRRAARAGRTAPPPFVTAEARATRPRHGGPAPNRDPTAGLGEAAVSMPPAAPQSDSCPRAGHLRHGSPIDTIRGGPVAGPQRRGGGSAHNAIRREWPPIGKPDGRGPPDGTHGPWARRPSWPSPGPGLSRGLLPGRLRVTGAPAVLAPTTIVPRSGRPVAGGAAADDGRPGRRKGPPASSRSRTIVVVDRGRHRSARSPRRPGPAEVSSRSVVGDPGGDPGGGARARDGAGQPAGPRHPGADRSPADARRVTSASGWMAAGARPSHARRPGAAALDFAAIGIPGSRARASPRAITSPDRRAGEPEHRRPPGEATRVEALLTPPRGRGGSSRARRGANIRWREGPAAKGGFPSVERRPTSGGRAMPPTRPCAAAGSPGGYLIGRALPEGRRGRATDGRRPDHPPPAGPRRPAPC